MVRSLQEEENIRGDDKGLEGVTEKEAKIEIEIKTKVRRQRDIERQREHSY